MNTRITVSFGNEFRCFEITGALPNRYKTPIRNSTFECPKHFSFFAKVKSPDNCIPSPLHPRILFFRDRSDAWHTHFHARPKHALLNTGFETVKRSPFHPQRPQKFIRTLICLCPNHKSYPLCTHFHCHCHCFKSYSRFVR